MGEDYIKCFYHLFTYGDRGVPVAGRGFSLDTHKALMKVVMSNLTVLGTELRSLK